MEQFRTMWKNPRSMSEDAKEEEILSKEKKTFRVYEKVRFVFEK